MTNLITQLAFVLSTNWTGHTFQNQELGYVKTNHVLSVNYEGSTNVTILKTDASNIAVWRTNNIGAATNIILYGHYDITNKFFNLSK